MISCSCAGLIDAPVGTMMTSVASSSVVVGAVYLLVATIIAIILVMFCLRLVVLFVFVVVAKQPSREHRNFLS